MCPHNTLKDIQKEVQQRYHMINKIILLYDIIYVYMINKNMMATIVQVFETHKQVNFLLSCLGRLSERGTATTNMQRSSSLFPTKVAIISIVL